MGDELMAMGEAAALSREYSGRPVVICGKDGKPRWHSLWTGAPYIRQPGDRVEGIGIRNGPGCRPYIQRIFPDRFEWQAHTPAPADLAHVKGMPAERGYIVIEPRLKAGASVNKQWPLSSWAALVPALRAAFPGHNPVMLDGPGALLVPGIGSVRHIATPTVRDWIIAMRGAALYVGHEGGSHHLAAALGVPAVVLFGGFVPPTSTGYAWHANLTGGGADACGNRAPCDHCAAAMAAITVDAVIAAAAEKILTGGLQA